MNTNETNAVVTRLPSEAQREFESMCALLLSPARVPEIKKLVDQLADPNNAPGFKEITPEMAAYIMTAGNRHNRDISYSKAKAYGAAMSRGEWKVNHQGIAFYTDGHLADGQHRAIGQVYSGTSQTFLVTANLSQRVIDTVDAVKQRSAGDALQLLGVEDSKMKATIGERVMAYEYELIAGKALDKPTVIQVEAFVVVNNPDLSTALEIGRKSGAKITEPTLGTSETATVAALLLRGGNSRDQVVAYIAAIQQGVASYEDSPTTVLSRRFLRAKLADKKSDRLPSKVKTALLVKGWTLWASATRVTKLDWKAGKEPLPSPVVGNAQQQAA